ncbi:MAG: Ldh family oxidoreductase, partial [Verrucomicrobiae bacterium]|nr:Ldh family oxidoreductase [Verrucomicrobiae bacterium]
FEKKARVGHHFAALDISRFIPLETYFDRIDTLAKEIKNAPRAEGVSEVLLPGESRWRALRRNRAEGVALDESAARKLAGWAERLKVKLPW